MFYVFCKEAKPKETDDLRERSFRICTEKQRKREVCSKKADPDACGIEKAEFPEKDTAKEGESPLSLILRSHFEERRHYEKALLCGLSLSDK